MCNNLPKLDEIFIIRSFDIVKAIPVECKKVDSNIFDFIVDIESEKTVKTFRYQNTWIPLDNNICLNVLDIKEKIKPNKKLIYDKFIEKYYIEYPELLL